MILVGQNLCFTSQCFFPVLQTHPDLEITLFFPGGAPAEEGAEMKTLLSTYRLAKGRLGAYSEPDLNFEFQVLAGEEAAEGLQAQDFEYFLAIPEQISTDPQGPEFEIHLDDAVIEALESLQAKNFEFNEDFLEAMLLSGASLTAFSLKTDLALLETWLDLCLQEQPLPDLTEAGALSYLRSLQAVRPLIPEAFQLESSKLQRLLQAATAEPGREACQSLLRVYGCHVLLGNEVFSSEDRDLETRLFYCLPPANQRVKLWLVDADLNLDLQASLSALLQQSYTDWQLHLVSERIEPLRALFPDEKRLIWHSSHGLEPLPDVADASFCGVLAAGEIWPTDYLASAISRFTEKPWLAAVCSGYEGKGLPAGVGLQFNPSNAGLFDLETDLPKLFLNFSCPFGTIFRTEMLKPMHLNLFRPAWAFRFDLWKNLLRGFEIAKLSQPLVRLDQRLLNQFALELIPFLLVALKQYLRLYALSGPQQSRLLEGLNMLAQTVMFDIGQFFDHALEEDSLEPYLEERLKIWIAFQDLKFLLVPPQASEASGQV
ncbi:hypothetical protein COW36_02890 [bacterium (Candidatus Blackallbacteria) CG17_big_fil_post_rev_8_21_14_2_50_48_46]|uniref:Uncharacterized protein n=1 Tax=bacterium (Candidatus Blackallbacteria) CG17_big_fil_post_rev_8_21_14_2_50_48_46 TaxID=2014261 RepID=A0A2M7GAF3_9BACT|nr:MAG: hypothetical protein COW64_12585 [bacterium (Candidatus Blackallbacteria) CG18_big_fil_WC_8_21_14_2_50_49_26]PIW19074.1 MAG: hypothetical protein COW36_02890 [bacterium (Candidatus Blackallbacteria) CG17_big_fil_post_rev_8_21_14_2_50_48_46]PIW44559.1 MAG: hypothetical protein COW20_23230 [bacterium (Candidatus Blackallbacteria) CG13_big_fil_rev_8_21_14_2_50_49_14]